MKTEKLDRKDTKKETGTQPARPRTDVAIAELAKRERGVQISVADKLSLGGRGAYSAEEGDKDRISKKGRWC